MNANATPETELLYEVSDGIGRIIFNRPQARNALTFGMYERLAAICEAAASDRTLKVLIHSTPRRMPSATRPGSIAC
jgi:enoyl-CoA hydratase